MTKGVWVSATSSERHDVLQTLKRFPEKRKEIKRNHAKMPFDAESVAKKFGLPTVKRNLPMGIAAFLNPARCDAGWEIIVNFHHSEELQFWAILHELAHYIGDLECEPPDYLDRVEPIPFLIAGSSNGEDILHRVNSPESLHSRPDGLSAEVTYTRDDLMLDDERLQRASRERKARYLSGYLAIPSWLFETRMNDAEIAVTCRVPLGVAKKQRAIYAEDLGRLIGKI